jgi:hypothetical protein
MRLSLFCNLNFTKVYINLEQYELYVKYVYLNLLGWRGMTFMKHFKGGGAQAIKVWEPLV